MTDPHARGRLDGLVEWGAPGLLAVAAGWAAFQLAPLWGYPALTGAALAATTLLIAGHFLLRSIGPEPRQFALQPFAEGAPDELLLDQRLNPLEELLLDRPAAAWPELLLTEPLVERESDQLAELLLDDPLAAPGAESRVVQLFAPEQLRQRIDRHLANAREASPDGRGEDAGDMLSEALAELKRSLRRA